MEQNNLISFANVKASLFDSEVLTLLAPSVYNPTPERLKHRAEEYAADSNVKAYACKNSEKYIGIVVLKTENDTAEILDIAVKPKYRKHGIGSMLIDYIFSKFAVSKITAETDNDAIGFYKKYGFIVADTKVEFDTKRYVCVCGSVTHHYDLSINENNDPVHDPKPLRDYMDKWDGQAFIEKMKLDKGKTVLEIGIGTGRLAIRTAPKCREFFGIDISPKTIEKTTENLAEYDNVSLICDDFLTHQFNRDFDVIYSSLTFMHIRDKQAAINKVRSLLNIGGRFVLSIDKNQSDTIDYGTRKIKIYPDNKEDIVKYITQSGMNLMKVFETDFAFVFIAEMKQNNS